MTRTSILVLVIAAMLPAGGCIFNGPTFEHDPGPGPSDAIATSVVPVGSGDGTTTVGCVGPEDELALLGSLCGASASYPSWSAHVGDQSIALGGSDGGAALLVLGFHTEELPDGEHNHTDDIRYAAYVVLEPPTAIEGSGWESTRQLMRSWPEGEALTGEVATERAVATACGVDFIGSATFLWRETTITVAWSSALPC
jgi:hypothetical protein